MWISRWRVEGGATHSLGLVRVVLGVVLFREALKHARALATSPPDEDLAHAGYLHKLLAPSPVTLAWVLAALLLLGALVTVGHYARAALMVSSVGGVYLMVARALPLNLPNVALSTYAFLLALSPCDQSLSLVPRKSFVHVPRPMWAARLAQLECSLLYFDDAWAKLMTAEWRSGQALLSQWMLAGGSSREGAIARVVSFALSRPDGASVIAKVAIATEIFLSLGLLLKRTRIPALWIGVWFHIVILLAVPSDSFSWLTLAIYGLFATADEGARKLYWDRARGLGRFYAGIIGSLDWLARFDRKAWEPDKVKGGHHIVIVRRNGTRATGVHALAMVARTCPLLFPLWVPLELVASLMAPGVESEEA